MLKLRTRRGMDIRVLLATLPLLIVALCFTAQGSNAATPRFDIYGHAMLDMGYEAGQSHPDWFDVARPTKLPSYENEFGEDGRFYSGVRQSRLGVKGFIPTDAGELRTTFEFELFGTGVDAGQTTFRLRHAYGELGQVGAGQTWSPFMDIEVFPNSLEYWGPNGMVFFRNVQLRWMPIQGDSRMTIAIERPGASADAGVYSDRIELQGVQARFEAPDVSAEYRYGQKWGYVEIAGIVRPMKWDDTNVGPGEKDLSGDAVGWGVNLSSNLKISKHVLRLQVVNGAGIQNYMNDAPVDVAVKDGKGEVLPVMGLVGFLDLNWSDKWTSTVGYSQVNIDTFNGQGDSAFKIGQYALADLLYYPAPGVMLGPEVQYVKRENKDGWNVDDVRVQFSVKYNFKYSTGGN
jgi:hypothetical protein